MADLQELVAKIRAYHFECQAGPLELCTDWLALMEALKPPTWTTEKPTKEGWYWWRKDSGDGWEIVSVVNVGRRDSYLLKKVHIGLAARMPANKGEWAGPILSPEEKS